MTITPLPATRGSGGSPPAAAPPCCHVAALYEQYEYEYRRCVIRSNPGVIIQNSTVYCKEPSSSLYGLMLLLVLVQHCTDKLLYEYNSLLVTVQQYLSPHQWGELTLS